MDISLPPLPSIASSQPPHYPHLLPPLPPSEWPALHLSSLVVSPARCLTSRCGSKGLDMVGRESMAGTGLCFHHSTHMDQNWKRPCRTSFICAGFGALATSYGSFTHDDWGGGCEGRLLEEKRKKYIFFWFSYQYPCVSRRNWLRIYKCTPSQPLM